MRKLGIDYGDARIGLALSDPMGIIASPLEVYARRGDVPDAAYIAALAAREQADALVIGNPKNMDGTVGASADKVLAFIAALRTTLPAMPVFLVDERWTTVSAERALIAADMRREKRRTVIDKIAAQIILQAYLDNPGIHKPI
ncbi:MAG: Holliday junction resolvase RuvX [Clostridiales bacterium]|jgi:putative Holliday junction resolvase|nr:Holliday junction resolvase RuvX [Clostridiales bacterium]